MEGKRSEVQVGRPSARVLCLQKILPEHRGLPLLRWEQRGGGAPVVFGL